MKCWNKKYAVAVGEFSFGFDIFIVWLTIDRLNSTFFGDLYYVDEEFGLGGWVSVRDRTGAFRCSIQIDCGLFAIDSLIVGGFAGKLAQPNRCWIFFSPALSLFRNGNSSWRSVFELDPSCIVNGRWCGEYESWWLHQKLVIPCDPILEPLACLIFKRQWMQYEGMWWHVPQQKCFRKHLHVFIGFFHAKSQGTDYEKKKRDKNEIPTYILNGNVGHAMWHCGDCRPTPAPSPSDHSTVPHYRSGASSVRKVFQVAKCGGAHTKMKVCVSYYAPIDTKHGKRNIRPVQILNLSPGGSPFPIFCSYRIVF